MQKLFDSKFPILIQGETGSGKTTLAQKIHNRSIYKNEPFVKCNLASLSDNLFTSELFGHIKGSFTGASSNKLGYCDLVRGGTLFLDEIGELSLIQQKKLLNILDDNSYQSVGCTRVKTFSGRFIFATHRNLESMVRKGSFREDLYYRLSCEPIVLKSFSRLERERRKEFIENRINQLSYSYGLKEDVFSREVIECFLNYHWPGNYREVVNTLEFLALKFSEKIIYKRDLPPRFHIEFDSKGSLAEQVSMLERKIIENEVVNKGMGVNKTSKSLGISKTTLIAKMRKYGITVHHFKEVSRVAA